MNTKKTVAKLDGHLRDKSGITQQQFVEHYCKVFRKHAYASTDGSWNEFEKLITHTLGMLIYYQRFCEIVGFEGKDGYDFDPRDFVWQFEDAKEAERRRHADKLAGILNHLISSNA